MSVYPGTNRRFRPSFLMSIGGGDSPQSVLNAWNKGVKDHYQSWIHPDDGTGVGLYKARVHFKYLAPSKGKYDWGKLYELLDLPMFQDPLVSFHWRIGSEGAMPGWWPDNWSGKAKDGQTSVNLTNKAFKDWLLGEFVPAYHDEFKNDERVYSFCWDETSVIAGTNINNWDNGFLEVVNALPKIITTQGVFVFNANTLQDRLSDDCWIGSADPKWNMSDIKPFPPGMTSWLQDAMNKHSVVLKDKPNKPAMMGSEPNGWVIRGDSKVIPNPWGGSFPNSAPHISSAKGIHPQSHVWMCSYKPRGNHKDSGLGQNGEDPPGFCPVSYILFPSSFGDTSRPNDHSAETPQMWADAMSIFGGVGTRAAPALPWNWKQADPDPIPDPDPTPDPIPDPDPCQELKDRLTAASDSLADLNNALILLGEAVASVQTAVDKLKEYLA